MAPSFLIFVFFLIVTATQVVSLSSTYSDSKILTAHIRSVKVNTTCSKLTIWSMFPARPYFYIATPFGELKKFLLTSEETVTVKVPVVYAKVDIRVGIDVLLPNAKPYACDDTDEIVIGNSTLIFNDIVTEYRLSGACFTALVDIIRPNPNSSTTSTLPVSADSNLYSEYVRRMDDPYVFWLFMIIISLTITVITLLVILMSSKCRRPQIPKSHVYTLSPTTTMTTHRSQTPPLYPSLPTPRWTRDSKLVTPVDHVYEAVQPPFYDGTPRIWTDSYASPFSNISTPSETSTLHYSLV